MIWVTRTCSAFSFFPIESLFQIFPEHRPEPRDCYQEVAVREQVKVTMIQRFPDQMNSESVLVKGSYGFPRLDGISAGF